MSQKVDPQQFPNGPPPAYIPSSTSTTPVPPPAHLIPTNQHTGTSDYYNASPQQPPYSQPQPQPQFPSNKNQQNEIQYPNPYQQYPHPQQPYGQQPGMGYPPQQQYPQQPYPYGPGPRYAPQGQYLDQRGRQSGAAEGVLGGCLAALACCCCLDFLF
ncbi:uncharacterized protein L3040_001971 [Drepanopeziza brunnea f. sp. 'multigermtubi']|uniref:Cysteine-rich transmembrane CYSTM domain-containing protein n=1 Tax=Marssonina brunnea f. sp. multigermtubi (strain MB_m1) TaxID=1072389 RepID=K1XFX1_MARBU|nr:uncharacterized protein MBM_01635 [Drepanopeziza brunnea f. sp. 'multigermtubi' MB_m1]EKD19683.1 hypothetical protein MBM_01635 [Drepanopeziza brunnea f. sp. 'multigermtubi' MB_m1]KAJ5052212.1 hypothetical protein L3040_001971 [Drepanopeziza brunnea f. sp. 'multigermtubi']